MEDVDNFETVFGAKADLAYQHQTIEQIIRNRRSLENELFFDKLLNAVRIDQGSKLYPPRSNQDLRNLYGRIVASASPDHHKQSLIYYILKDLPAQAQSAEAFAKSSFIPNKYQIFIDGIWFLDRLMFERALDFLTEPCLIPTFPEEILHTLCRHCSQDDPALPLAYYYTVSPAIKTTKVLEAFFSTMCRASVTEAFFFSRSQGELVHQHLFEQLISFAHTDSKGEIRANRAIELIGLPLDDREEAWLEDCLTDGKAKTAPGAKDTVIMRKIATGRSQKAIELSENMSGRKIDGVNWATLQQGLQQASKPLMSTVKNRNM